MLDKVMVLHNWRQEKLAKIDPPDFVTITVEPQATIAADLSEYVKGE